MTAEVGAPPAAEASAPTEPTEAAEAAEEEHARRQHRRRRWILVVTPVLVMALAGVMAVVVMFNRAEANPRVMPGEARIILDQRYANLPGNAGTADVFLPAKGTGPFPVVMWTSGSGWSSDQGNVGGEQVAAYLVAQGYAVVSYSVRNSDQAVFPAQLHDAKAAVRWVRANAERLNLDPDRIAAAGNSSGGWIATMLGVTGGMPTLEGDVGVRGESSEVGAVVNFFAPTDFLQINRHMIPGACEEFNRAHRLVDCHDDPRAYESRLIGASILTHPHLVAAASPLTYVDAGDPPTLIAHGTQDMVVPDHQSTLLYSRMASAGTPVAYYEVHGAGHDHGFARATREMTTVVRSAHLDPVPPQDEQLSWKVIARFLDEQLGVESR